MSTEWVVLGIRGAGTDDVYYKVQHIPCGTVLEVSQGYNARLCPKCHAKVTEKR